MQKDIIYKFHFSEETFLSSGSRVGGTVHTKIDVERMKEALSGRPIPAPTGMNKEEMRQFILSHARTTAGK